MQFIWDETKAKDNERDHGVAFEEAKEAFRDPHALEECDGMHDEKEPRFWLIGLSSRRLLLVVFSTPDDETIRIISVRKAAPTLKRAYEKQKI